MSKTLVVGTLVLVAFLSFAGVVALGFAAIWTHNGLSDKLVSTAALVCGFVTLPAGLAAAAIADTWKPKR